MITESPAVNVITLITAICGATFGFSALLLNLASFLRDRARFAVVLRWDVPITATPTGPLTYDPKKLYGVVEITNIGRRPVYLATVNLRLPDGSEPLLGQAVKETKLSEGDPPARYSVDPDLVLRYAATWDQIRAIAKDSTGRAYRSKKVRTRPSWGNP